MKRTVFFYRSLICPRCLAVAAILKRLQNEEPGLRIETVEVTCHPLAAWRAGVRMFPALKVEDRIFSSLLPTESEIRLFLRETGVVHG